MITEKEYKKHNLEFWLNKKVRNLTVLKNGLFEYPVGTTFFITDKYAGFQLEVLNPCPVCGRKCVNAISRVPPEDLELVAEDLK